MSSKVLLSGKIHRARVTQADLDYVGSVSIDEGLMEAAGIIEWEKVAILDVTLMVRGLRLTQSRRPGDLEKYA